MEIIDLFFVYNLAVLYKMISNTRRHFLHYIKTISQGDVGERFVGGVLFSAGKEGRVEREEDVRENSNRPHV